MKKYFISYRWKDSKESAGFGNSVIQCPKIKDEEGVRLAETIALSYAKKAYDEVKELVILNFKELEEY